MKEFDKYDAKYFEAFGKPYPITITSQLTEEQHIAKMKKAIEMNTPVVPKELDAKREY